MSKYEGSWSGMRKYLEKEMLAECLKGRVRYNCTRYVGMDGCHLFELYVDNTLQKRFSWETVNTYFIANGLGGYEKPYGIGEYWSGFMENLASIKINDRTEYTDDEFCDALAKYRNQSISESISSDNPLERMFAIFDRRIGKRKILQMKESFNAQPEWLQKLYQIRCNSEAIR